MTSNRYNGGVYSVTFVPAQAWYLAAGGQASFLDHVGSYYLALGELVATCS